ncbi:hypothetical protein E4T49_07285 [Aureobasidium sp. EXF-10728]|nr:hypothetical protein E4T49_07285 [Aureobasidium sp. EXF-10728]
MFSGCRDDETSADAQINGVTEDVLEYVSHPFIKLGAMSWAFLESTKNNPDPTYKEASHEYTQVTLSSFWCSKFVLIVQKVPQLCVGTEMDLNQPLLL